MRWKLVIGVLAFSFCTSSQVHATMDFSRAACAHLRSVVARKYHPIHGPNEYGCDMSSVDSSGRYYVMALHAKYLPPGTPNDWAGSRLVGWFAVSKSTGDVFTWSHSARVIGTKFPQ